VTEHVVSTCDNAIQDAATHYNALVWTDDASVVTRIVAENAMYACICIHVYHVGVVVKLVRGTLHIYVRIYIYINV